MNVGEKSNHSLSKFIPVRTKTKDLKRCTENVEKQDGPKGGDIVKFVFYQVARLRIHIQIFSKLVGVDFIKLPQY